MPVARSNSIRTSLPAGEGKANAIIKTLQTQSLPTFSKNKLSQWLSEENVKSFNKILLDKTFRNHVALEDTNALEKELFDYFQACYDYEMVPTISSMSCWLGVNRNVIYEVVANKGKNGDILSQAVDFCHSLNENGALSGSINSVLYMFLSKNYYGMQDNSTLNLTTGIQNPTINNEATMRVIQEQLAIENTSKTNLNVSNSDDS